jgi:hypothetical protein
MQSTLIPVGSSRVQTRHKIERAKHIIILSLRILVTTLAASRARPAPIRSGIVSFMARWFKGRIVASHATDPGSSPGRAILLLDGHWVVKIGGDRRRPLVFACSKKPGPVVSLPLFSLLMSDAYARPRGDHLFFKLTMWVVIYMCV